MEHQFLWIIGEAVLFSLLIGVGLGAAVAAHVSRHPRRDSDHGR